MCDALDMRYRARYVHFVNEICIISSLSVSENISILRRKNIEQSQDCISTKNQKLKPTKNVGDADHSVPFFVSFLQVNKNYDIIIKIFEKILDCKVTL